MNREQRARAYFLEGYNCAQSVGMAFSDLIGFSEEETARYLCGFGGGFSRMREMCGAISGMVFVLNVLYGHSLPKSHQEKADYYALVQTLIRRFEEEFGYCRCGDLLGVSGPEAPVPEERTEEYYQKRPCPNFIGRAAAILEEYLRKENGKEDDDDASIYRTSGKID